MRYDEQRGIYRDCKWCGGKGCLACPGEAEKEYNRQFPDGPKPIATFSTESLGEGGVLGLLESLLGPKAIESAESEAGRRAAMVISKNPMIAGLAGCSEAEAETALSRSLVSEVIQENIVKAGQSTR
jgi:hypothetical protein